MEVRQERGKTVLLLPYHGDHHFSFMAEKLVQDSDCTSEGDLQPLREKQET